MFSMNLPADGKVEYELYRRKRVYTKVTVTVSAGYITSLDQGTYIYGKIE